MTKGRLKLRTAMIQKRTIQLSLLVGLIICALLSISCRDDYFVENQLGIPVPAAFDLVSCDLLALKDFSPSISNQQAYEHAIQLGKIVFLENGTGYSAGAGPRLQRGPSPALP
jgi:hypothetical protein